MIEEQEPRPGEPLRITVRPRSDDFARVAEQPQPQQLEHAPWLGQDEGDDALPPSAAPTQGTLPSAPWIAGSGASVADSGPLSGLPSAPWAKAEEKKPEEDVRPMPSVPEALWQGIASGWGGAGKTAAMPFGRPKVDEDVSPAASPYEMRDLWSPSRALSKTAYALGSGTPTIATGIAGGVTGAALTGGNPVGALAGGSVGAMLGTAIQTLGPVYAAELKKTPDDVDGAWERAVVQSGISSLFSGAGWAAFPLKFFNGPIKNMMTQAIGVQPGIHVAEKATQNVAAGKDITNDLGQAYIQGTVGSAIPAVGQLGVKVAGRGVKQTVEDVLSVNQLFRDLQMGLTPMAAETATPIARAAAKDFANDRRNAMYHWNAMHEKLLKVATPEQRKAMWEAADAESIARQQGMSPADIAARGIGLSTLDPRLRNILDVLQRDSQMILDEAKRVGIFEGEGLPSYTPRIVQMMMADGPQAPKSGGPPTVAPSVTGIHTTTPQMKGRRYFTVEETEAAAKQRLGAEAEVVRDIAVLPMATAKLQEAVAGRALINKIKEIGAAAGTEVVSVGTNPGNWFTMNHPSFTTYRVRRDQKTGKVVFQENGNPVFDRVPIYIHPGFKGPLHAVLESGNHHKIYQGLMELKSKATMAIMYSPLIHNAVEFGRALPASWKVGAFGKIYFEGYRERNKPGAMEAAIADGLVPIGKRYGIQDITGIMEAPNLEPGRGWTAKGLAATLGKLPQKGMTRAEVERGIKQSVDKAGDFWHGTLLWERIADLQFGLYHNYKNNLQRKGFDEKTASRMAAHFANRYAGAIPMESMSEMARKVANLTMFSRSFTLGNIGAMKDAVNGLPRDIQAQILRDAGPAMLDKAKGYARRKSQAILLMDMALAYGMNTALQSGLRVLMSDDTIGDVGKEYAERALHLLKNPTANPFKAVESLTEMHHNEPGRKERVFVGYQDDGTALYARNPAGKIGEEFVGWLTSPLEMVKKKESTMFRPLMESFSNDKGFGRHVYSKHDMPHQILWDVAKHFMLSQVPTDAITGGWDLMTGEGTEDERRLNKLKLFGPLAGVTFSKGAPGGPAAGEMFNEKDKFEHKLNQAMPEIRKLIKRGHTKEADAIMDQLKLTKEHRQYIYRTSIEPASRLKGRKMKDFYRRAEPEALENLERAMRRRQP